MALKSVYPISAARALALHTQGLTRSTRADLTPTRETILKIAEQLGCIQIDTLNLVQRSHYLILWSRLGAYNTADFDTLVYSHGQRSLFEGWQRVASFIPLNDFRYQLPRMQRMREDHSAGFLKWFDREGHELMDMVLERIRKEGALRAADFEYHGPKLGSWWAWKPAKTALEYLFAFGDLMITNRVNFQRVYDLAERVMPDWVDTSVPSLEQRDRYWIEQAALALGIFTPRQLIGYSYFQLRPVQAVVDALINENVLLKVHVKTASGDVLPYLVHQDNLEVLRQVADGAIQAERTTFLSPFDNLWWAAGRDEQLWGFRQRLEAYTPAHKRVWGYFCLPILHKDRLVGRFDPKVERKEGLLRLKSLYLEEGVEPGEELVRDVAYAMHDFMKFHKASEIVIEKSQPAGFGEALLRLW